MAFRKVTGSRKYYKYNECTVGQRLVDNGEYLGSEEGKYDIQHLFNCDGQIVVLNSAGQLNWQMKNLVKTGQRVNIEYLGKTVIPKGKMAGKEAHNFGVEVDDVKLPPPPPDLTTTTTVTANYNGTDLSL